MKRSRNSKQKRTANASNSFKCELLCYDEKNMDRSALNNVLHSGLSHDEKLELLRLGKVENLSVRTSRVTNGTLY